MNRILTTVLALVFICAALSGCGKAKNKEEPPTDEKGGTMTLTIVETQPGGAAFEYQLDGPYCFYAEDAGENLYRVLWSDFTGLEEKDRVIVKYHDLKKLTYTEYPDGGWTPPYEMTATDVTVDNPATDTHITADCTINAATVFCGVDIY